ncbi:MAG TPA: PAS-domain containing protein, partial [Rhodopseudomonas sp.]|uniref:PAS-domain containing protein n=1 Tax=Rhodopseudomonas sp. TaxID=1078 RepID=UPI002ED91E5A
MKTIMGELVWSSPHGRLSPRNTMFAAATLVVLTVLAAGVTIWNLHDKIDRETRGNLGKISMVLAEQTSRSFQSVDTVLGELAARIGAGGPLQADRLRATVDSQTLYQVLQEHARRLPQVSNLIVANADGWLVAHSRSWPTPQLSIAEREQFKRLRDTDEAMLVVSEPMRSKVDGSWTLYLARRINDANHQFVGAVEAAVKLRDFEEFYEAVALEGSSVALWRRDGTLLARYPRLENKVGSSIGSEAMTRDLAQTANRGGVWVAGLDGQPRYVARTAVPNFPLVVTVAIPADIALGTWRRDAIILFIGVLGAVGGVVVLLVALGRQIRGIRHSELLLARQNFQLERSGSQLLEAQKIGKLGHWEADVKQMTATWSPQLFEIAGLAVAPVVTFDTVLSLVHPDDIEGFLGECKRAKAARSNLTHEHRWIRPDGQLRWVRIEANPRRDADGGVAGVFGIVLDITNLKRAEERASNSQRMLSDAIESFSQGFILYDSDDRFVLANSRFREMYPEVADLLLPGALYEDILRGAAARGAFGADPEEIEIFVTWAMAWHRKANQPIEQQIADGRWVRMSEHRTSDGGIAGLRTDVTDFKLVEAALQQRVADVEMARNDLEAQQSELIEAS